MRKEAVMAGLVLVGISQGAASCEPGDGWFIRNGTSVRVTIQVQSKDGFRDLFPIEGGGYKVYNVGGSGECQQLGYRAVDPTGAVIASVPQACPKSGWKITSPGAKLSR